MADLLVCRVCLASDVKLYNMYENRLVWPYEFLTGLKIQKTGQFSYRTCGVCSTLLHKWMSFRDLCHSSQNLIQFANNQNHKVTVEYVKSLNLNLNALSSLTIDHNIANITCAGDDTDVKVEEEEAVTTFDHEDIVWENLSEDEVLVEQADEIVEKEIVIQLYKNQYMCGVCSTEFQNEEELLKHIETDGLCVNTLPCDRCGETFNQEFELKEHLKSHSKVVAVKCEEEEETDGFPNTESVEDTDGPDILQEELDLLILTKEQQREEVQERKTSKNYLNSFYKCDKCFKGFMTETTYANHMARHDPSNGPVECDICHTYWPTVSGLKTHVASTHENKYICRLCSLVCKSKHKAKEHLKWHSGHIFVCKICGAEFEKSTSHLTHLRLQHPSDHICGLCGESFVSPNGLKMHRTKAHKDIELYRGKYVCAVCSAEFKNEGALMKHIKDTDGACIDMLTCVHCGESFNQEYHLKEHLKTHSKEVTVKCEECDKSFVGERQYVLHYQRVHLSRKRRHRGEPTYVKPVTVCEICGKKCITNSGLVYHQRIHTGEKPYQCPHCPKKFSIHQRLQIHVRTHTGESPFKCSHCPKAFKHKAALNRHDRVHTGVKPYSCSHCGKCFSQSNSMKIHVKTVHLKQPAPYRNKHGQVKIS